MQDLNLQFEAIVQKVHTLTGLIEKLQTDNANLQKDKEDILNQNRDLHKKIEDLENNNLNLQKVEKAAADEKEGQQALKIKLDAFITEIDECIARLKG